MNPKYLSLRKKLDGLKFTEHLDPRSVDLVERIFNEYSKLLDRFKEPKKNVTPPTDNVAVAALNEQIDYLNDQNHKLRAEIDTLKTKSVATQQNNGVEEKIMKLNTTLHEYRLKYDEKVKEYNEEIRKLSEEVELLRLRNK